MTVYFTSFHWKKAQIYIAATKSRLCFVGADEDGLVVLKKFVHRYMKEKQLQRNDEKMAPYKKQIKQYLTGQQTSIDLPIELYGTSFQQKVWRALLTIPYGTTTTYTAIAEKISHPTATRAVANAIGQNPLLFIVPCHRVLRKDGQLSGFRAGIPMKKALLNLEQMKV